MAEPPDLLSLTPSLRVDRAAMRQALAFAFAAGVEEDSFERILAVARLPPSSWDRAHYERDLFLEDLVERCLPVKAAGAVYEPCLPYLARVIRIESELMEPVGPPVRERLLDVGY